MRVMVLVPTVPLTLDAKVPWHFFQELQPLARRGIQLCVVSAVLPEYSLPGLQFMALEPVSLRRQPMQARGVLSLAWRYRTGRRPWGLIGSTPWRKALRCFQWEYSLLPIAREWRPDIIHSHWAFPANTAGASVARKLGIPLVMTLRGFEHRIVPQFVYGNCLDPVNVRALVDALNAAAIITVTCTDSIGRVATLGIRPDERIRIVYNGVNVDLLSMGATDAPRLIRRLERHGEAVVTCIARFGTAKGHETLLRAVARKLHRRDRLKLLLVGDGPNRPAMQRLAGELGLSEQAVFYGAAHPREIGGLLRISTLTVLPSYSETFANVVFESLAMGTPVVSTAVGTPRDLLEPYGLLVPPGDVDALEQAIDQVLSDLPTARQRAAEGGRFVRENLTLQRRAAAFESIYAELLGHRPFPPQTGSEDCTAR